MIWAIFGIFCSVLATLFFSTVTYALRDFSRSRLEDQLSSYRRSRWLDYTISHQVDLIFVTGLGRLIANMCLLLLSLRLFYSPTRDLWVQYLGGMLLAGALGVVFSVALPTALARYAGEPIIAISVQFLHGLRVVLLPITRIMHSIDTLVRRLTGGTGDLEPEQVEKDILSAVEEGEKEGVVDTQERQMIESVIEFRDTEAAQAMTGRPEIVGVEVASTLEEIKRTIVDSGHSRLPVYDATLDHIIGILYARDLLKYVGETAQQFDIRSAIRPAIFVPEAKPLRDLLHEFRSQKVHIAIVLDEYGGTAGLVTIEDILEQLVGEISDEHEPAEPPMFKRLAENAFEVDARLPIEELNREGGLAIPEDAGFETVGGYISTTLGRIPQKGTTFEQAGARYTVLDAEPQRIKRLKVELLAQPAKQES